MARFDRLTVYSSMLESGMIPLFYSGDLGTAKEIAAACAQGGATVIEMTNRGDGAIDVFTDLLVDLQSANPEIILGVGSIMDAPTAAMYIAAGANFIVAPMLNPEVAKLCNRRQIPYIPGCGTVSEISEAQELGCEIIKIFPAEQMGGPGFIKAMLGPMPWSRILVAGGVDATSESVNAWLAAGAAVLGIGGNLIRKDLVAARDFATIRENVGRVVQWISEARSK